MSIFCDQRLGTWKSEYNLRCISAPMKGIFRKIFVVYINSKSWNFDIYMFSYYTCCVFKHSSPFISIDLTPSILRRWCIACAAWRTVWSVFGRVSVVALWCLYIDIVWLWVEGIKCGVNEQQVALCVCVSALCGCERRELNVEWVCSWWLCVFVYRHCVVVSRGN